MICEACGNARTGAWLIARGYELVRCPSCGHGQQTARADIAALRRRYDHDYFFGDPDGYADYLSAEPAHRINARRHLDVVERLARPPGKLLDVGCAAGFLLDEARAAGWVVAGVEPSRRWRASGSGCRCWRRPWKSSTPTRAST